MICRCLLAITTILFLFANSASAQVLKQMEVIEVPESESTPYVVRQSDEAVLIVHSVIRQLQFESTNTIKRVEDDGAGEYKVHLRPGTHMIKFKVDGFMAVQKRYVIAARKHKEVRVVPKGVTGEKVLFGTVEFEMSPGPVLVVQDSVQIGELQVASSGVFRMDLPPGQHQLKFIRMGSGSYETQVEVEVGQTQREVVHFVASEIGQYIDSMLSGVLYVKSDQEGATVYVDGAKAGSTPLQIRKIAIGAHQIRIEKSMYNPVVKRVNVSVNTITTVDEKLTPDFGELTLDTYPTGVDVFVDDKYVGVTPYQVSMFSCGQHTVALRKASFHDVTWSLAVDPGNVIDTVISMPPAFGILSVTSKPNGASVFLDNQVVGKTPFRRDTISSGQYVVRVEKRLYGTLEISVTIQDNQETVVSTPLDRNFGTIGVTSRPSGIEVKLVGTGKILGVTPLHLDIRPGSHTIILENDDYGPYSETINLRASDSVIIAAGSMVRKTGVLRIFTDPPEADLYIDGALIGKSPQIVTRPTGEYQIEAQLEKYVSETRAFVVQYGSVGQLDMTLEERGAIEIEVVNSGDDAEAGDKKTTSEAATGSKTLPEQEPAGDSQAAFHHPVRNEGNKIVTIRTNYGDMTLELWHDVAPNHADSFLARTNDGFYDRLIFHRVVDGFMIQGGCPLKNGTGNAGYFLISEFSDNPHLEGTLSMARSRSPHSASCQFFICLVPAPHLDKEPNKYTVFGQLLKGYDVLHKIGKVEVKAGSGNREVSKPVKEVIMENVFISDAEGKPLGK